MAAGETFGWSTGSPRGVVVDLVGLDLVWFGLVWLMEASTTIDDTFGWCWIGRGDSWHAKGPWACPWLLPQSIN